MAWVTLSLRKMELINQHNALEMEDLRISREKRQMAREYQLLQTYAQNEYRDEIRNARNKKKQTIDGLQSEFGDDYLNNPQYQKQYDEATEQYQESYDQLTSESEDECAMLEQEASDAEAMLDQQKVQIETQMESVAAEMDAIKQQISTDIQNETIQLH